MAYALGHSNLRKALSITFQRISQPGDLELLTKHITPTTYSKVNSAIEDNERQDEDEDESNSLSKRDFLYGHAYEWIAYAYDDYKDANPSLT